MIHLLDDDKIALRKAEIQNIKEELKLEKSKLEEEILTKTKDVEKLRVRSQLYERVRRQYIGEGMKGFEENFTKPINKLFFAENAQLELLCRNKIEQIENIIHYIENDITK